MHYSNNIAVCPCTLISHVVTIWGFFILILFGAEPIIGRDSQYLFLVQLPTGSIAKIVTVRKEVRLPNKVH
jgi:hypothetical protein